MIPLFALVLFDFRALVGHDPGRGTSWETQSGAEQWFFSPAAGSPVLVLAVSASILFARGRWLLHALGGPTPRLLTAALLLSSSLLCVWSYYVAVPDLLIPSLALAIMGTGAALSGGRGLRLTLFPALFLVFAVTPPGVAVNQLVFPMQMMTAELSTRILSLLGISALRDADLIFTDSGVFQVIETCSGLRTLHTLAMAAVLYGEVFRVPRLRFALLLAASPLIAVGMNQIRVVSIVLNPLSTFSSVHTIQGIVMLVLGVLALAALDRLLSRTLPAPRADEAPRVEPEPALGLSAFAVRRVLPLMALFLAVAIGTVAIAPWTPGPLSEPLLSLLPARFEGWVAESLKIDTDYLGTTGFREWVHRSYTRGEDTVELFMGSNDRQNRSVSLVSDKTVTLNRGWRIVDRDRWVLEPDALEVDAFRIRSRRDERLVLRWYEDVGAGALEVVRGWLALDRSPLGRERRAKVYRIAAAIGPEPGGVAAAERRVREFHADWHDAMPR